MVSYDLGENALFLIDLEEFLFSPIHSLFRPDCFLIFVFNKTALLGQMVPEMCFKVNW